MRSSETLDVLLMNTDSFPKGCGSFQLENSSFGFEKRSAALKWKNNSASETMIAVYEAFQAKQKLSISFEVSDTGVKVFVDLNSPEFRSFMATSEQILKQVRQGKAEAEAKDWLRLSFLLRQVSDYVVLKSKLDRPARTQSLNDLALNDLALNDLASVSGKSSPLPTSKSLPVLHSSSFSSGSDVESDGESRVLADRNSPVSESETGSVPMSFFGNPVASLPKASQAQAHESQEYLALYLVRQFFTWLMSALLALCTLYEHVPDNDYPPVVFRY